MSKMYIRAIRLTKDTSSIKVAYERDGKYYVRSGKDNFRKGIPLNGNPSNLVATWGFRKIEDAPYFYDGSEIAENIGKFQMDNKGRVLYQG